MNSRLGEGGHFVSGATGDFLYTALRYLRYLVTAMESVGVSELQVSDFKLVSKQTAIKTAKSSMMFNLEFNESHAEKTISLFVGFEHKNLLATIRSKGIKFIHACCFAYFLSSKGERNPKDNDYRWDRVL